MGGLGHGRDRLDFQSFKNRKSAIFATPERQYPKIGTWKKWNSVFFCQRHALFISFDIFAVTYRVTNFLPKLMDMLLFFMEKAEFPFLVIPIFGNCLGGHACYLAGHSSASSSNVLPEIMHAVAETAWRYSELNSIQNPKSWKGFAQICVIAFSVFLRKSFLNRTLVCYLLACSVNTHIHNSRFPWFAFASASSVDGWGNIKKSAWLVQCLPPCHRRIRVWNGWASGRDFRRKTKEFEGPGLKRARTPLANGTNGTFLMFFLDSYIIVEISVLS